MTQNKNNFSSIFGNPYADKHVEEKTEQPIAPSQPENNVKNEVVNTHSASVDTIFHTKVKKEKKMIYIKTSSSSKLEKIAKKYKLSISEILDIMIENQQY